MNRRLSVTTGNPSGGNCKCKDRCGHAHRLLTSDGGGKALTSSSISIEKAADICAGPGVGRSVLGCGRVRACFTVAGVRACFTVASNGSLVGFVVASEGHSICVGVEHAPQETALQWPTVDDVSFRVVGETCGGMIALLDNTRAGS